MSSNINIKQLDLDLPYALEEALNSLRINVGFLGEDIKKIMVVSSFPNEGKSMIALNLWKQLSNAGMSACYVDLDLRNSLIIDKYGMELEDKSSIKGLSHLLSSNDAIEDYIYKTKYGNSCVIPNSKNIINPSLLLEGKRFTQLLDTLSNKFRYVLLDVPPIQLISDAERIGSMCDGCIVVVRANETSKKAVHDTINKLERSGCKVLGIVLNRVDTKSRKYYYGNKNYYHHDYYYGGGGRK